MDKVAAEMPNDPNWVSALQGLERARFNQDILMMPHLQTISRYLPQLFSVNVTSSAKKSDFQVTANAFLSRAVEKLPFIPCKIHIYSSTEVLKCTEKHLADTGKPIRIAFVGDSRVRVAMQQMIRSTLNELHYKHPGETNDVDISLSFLDQKLKINLPVKGTGIELRLHWSAYLEMYRNPDDVSQQGASDLLEAWVSGRPDPVNDGPIPDVVYMTSGLWDTSMSPEDQAVSEFINTLQKITPILKALAKKTRILWHVHGPIKEWLATRDIPNGALDMMNRASWKYLSDSNIWLWDSHTVMMLKQYSECQRLSEADLHKSLPKGWGCQDFQHAGHDVEDAAGNMLWNLRAVILDTLRFMEYKKCDISERFCTIDIGLSSCYKGSFITNWIIYIW
ncbi:hypothetical protein SK128_004450 [Halocaridina rubra]|uniref:Uncharacterized protein n=1 Tax=Halocaridina rubra TaxID=373956 RepID=A0AAN9AH80_HALRR